MSTFPNPVYQWRSVSFAARLFECTPRCVQKWCRNGRFTAIGVTTYQARNGRWWILLQSEENALNTNSLVDTLP